MIRGGQRYGPSCDQQGFFWQHERNLKHYQVCAFEKASESGWMIANRLLNEENDSMQNGCSDGMGVENPRG